MTRQRQRHRFTGAEFRSFAFFQPDGPGAVFGRCRMTGASVADIVDRKPKAMGGGALQGGHMAGASVIAAVANGWRDASFRSCSRRWRKLCGIADDLACTATRWRRPQSGSRGLNLMMRVALVRSQRFGRRVLTSASRASAVAEFWSYAMFSGGASAGRKRISRRVRGAQAAPGTQPI